MSKLIYKKVIAQQAASRFGSIETSKGTFDMPVPSPGIRTHYDVNALIENIKNGMYPRVISPYASCKNSIMSGIKGVVGLSYENEAEHKIKVKPNILIVPDPEYEALSFNCSSRYSFAKLGGMDANFRGLFETRLSGGKVEQTWNEITKNFGYTGIKDWATNSLDGVESDVFLAPTSIIFADKNSVSKAFNHGYNVLDEALNEAKFTLYGIHFLLHNKILLENNDDAIKARQEIYKELDTWSNSNRERYSGLIFSFKIYDNNRTLLDPNSGSLRRQNLSEFVTEVSERVRRADGGVVAHNFGNWVLGLLDSGADICSFRMSGETKIEVPIIPNAKARATIRQRKKSAPILESIPKMPPFFNYDTLTDCAIDDLKKMWETEKSYPLPSCIPNAEPWWEFEDYNKRLIYCIRARCGSLIELGEEYRKAGIDIDGIPLCEAILSRVKSSKLMQDLQDLCPSLSNTNYGSV